MKKQMLMDNDANVLPAGFTGVFTFTNWTDEDFVSKWDNIEYTFPANTTVPLVIPRETPEGVQSIRKKFARELAEREFYRSDKGRRMESKEAGARPALYTDNDLAPFVQKCLEPLAQGEAKVRVVQVDNEQVFKTDNKGKKITRVLDEGESLTGDGTVIG